MKKISLLFCLMHLILFLNAQDVVQWRGIDRKGIYKEEQLLKVWPVAGPEKLWLNNEVGDGYGSPAITTDKIFITGAIDSIGYLFAIDLQGILLWKSDYGKEWIKSFPGSRSTPTVVDSLVYVCSGIGNIGCFDLTGKIIWFANMLKDKTGRLPYHGHSESPLVFQDKVFFVNGGVDSNVIAFNRFTGKIMWVCKGQSEIAGYNSPVLIQLGKRTLLVTFSAYSLMGIDVESGELLWVHKQDNVPLAERKPGNGDTHSNSAWYENGFIYYIAGDGNCAVKLELLDNGKQVKEVWRNKDIDNFMGGFIKVDNKIYSCTNSRKDLKCIDAISGQVTDSLKIGVGTIVMADNMLYYYNQKGEVMLINSNKEKMELISSFKIDKGTKEHFAHPVIKNGVLYIRHGQSLIAYNIKKQVK
ncbi:MAG: PQQ-binding-like beta-propeller repeat protein [Bacteroidia bacterium]|nr:PQQ-binding-like beta-propeller repeat protein [Bacteroidia bacterium]